MKARSLPRIQGPKVRSSRRMMIGPTREDSKVVSQGELWELWNQDSNQPCWASLSLAFCLPSWQFPPSSLSLFLRFCLSFLLLCLAFLSLLSHSLIPFCLSLFQFQSFSSFLPSLSPPLYLSLLLSFAFSSFRSSTLLFPFSDFLLLSFSGSIFPGSFLPLSSFLFLRLLLSVLFLLSSLCCSP